MTLWLFFFYRFRKERWFEDERAEQLGELAINDDAAEGGNKDKPSGKKQKVSHDR